MRDEKLDIKEQMAVHLCREYNLSADQAQAMVQIGCQGIKKNLDNIAEIIASDPAEIDRQALGEAAHSLKGVLLNLGLDIQAESAKKLERAVENGIEPGLVEGLLAFSEEL